ncbi:glycosyltransferase family 2 protein [Catenuloplanes atrovinosus]|uniref:GT2 family glycosyltransferase n=1 Tax=Catenuloplanes atrovinosus TaxID=137266 RepID=A0AAE3YWH5_9ACTN|nr:glycosyltransferase family 2 protein [Catenuloplanes atrovinosus]MDR7281104.1 GT2 family glycosyltransferase [Catenuloplanes atrovinosus]
MTDVSVIVVSYNTSELTIRGLTTLLGTPSTASYEVIVVDNASSDGSADAIEAALPQVRVVRLPRNVGFGRAVNAGATHATGDYLMLLNPDAEPVGDVIGAFLSYASANPAPRVYVGRTLDVHGADDGRSIYALPTLWGYFCFATGLSTLFRRSALLNPEELPDRPRDVPGPVPAGSGCLLLIDRALFTALGGFTADYFMYSEDIDLSQRATAAGATPTLVPEAKVLHVNGASSTSVNKRIMVLRGKTTYLRLRWSPTRARAGRALLLTGIALRAAASRLTGRAPYWRDVWSHRTTWLPGWPAPDTASPTGENTPTAAPAVPTRQL